MNAWDTFRLAAWREGFGRWPLHGVVLLLAVAGALAPSDWSFMFPFVAGLALFVLIGVVASGGRHAADPFWRGLGGPGWARIAGTVAVQMSPLALALVALDLGLIAPLYLVVYATVVAARALGGGLRLVFAPLGTLLVLGVALSSVVLLFQGGLRDIYLGWFLGTAVLALVCAALWEHRVEGARLGRRGWGFVAPIALLLLGSYGLTAAASLLPAARYPAWGQDLPSSGEVLLVPIGRWATFGHTQVWRNGERRDVGPPGAWNGSIGPHGSVVLNRGLWTRRAVLVTEGGETVRCDEPIGSVDGYAWRGDGRAVILKSDDWWYRFDLSEGCARFASRGAAWLGDDLVSATGAVVQVGEGRSLDAPGPVLDIVQSEGHVYVLAGDTLHELTREGLDPFALVMGSELWAMPNGVCADAQGRCWYNGTRVPVDHGGAFPFDVDLAWDFRNQQLYVPSTGRAIASSLDAPINATRLSDGSARTVEEGKVIDYSPTGVVTEHYF